jgi:hypothetical protein
MPAYKLTRGQDWQQVRAPDWQRGAVSEGTILSVMVADYYPDTSQLPGSWPRPPPDISGVGYPTGANPGWYYWREYLINPSSGPIDDTDFVTVAGGKITGSVNLGATWICDTLPANPRAWAYGAPEALRPGGMPSICLSQKTKISLPLSGVLAYYHTRLWSDDPSIIMWPHDDYLITVAPDSASYVTISAGSALELIAPEPDYTIHGSSICQFWPGMVLSDFPTPDPGSGGDGLSGGEGLSSDDLPLSTA